MVILSHWAAWLVVLWSSCYVVSLAGWGALAARFLDGGEPAPLGLRMGWGTAVVLLIGGPLLALHLAYGPVLSVLVGLGLLLWAGDLVLRRAEVRTALRDRARDVVANPATTLVALVVVAAALVVVSASAFEPASTFRTDDDGCAYLAFPREMVMTGGSEQPFSIRHAFSLNGQFFLEALLLGRLHAEQMFVLDRGIFLIVAIFAVIGLSRRPWLQRQPYALLPELALVLLPNIRVNTASYFTGLVILLTLYSTIARAPGVGEGPRSRWWRPAVGIGLTAGAALVLRPMYAPPVALAVAVACGPQLWRSWARARASLAEGLVIATAALVFLAPWMVVGWRSDGTPMYPLLEGTVRRFPPVLPYGRLFVPRVVWYDTMTDDTFRTPLVMVLAGLCLVDDGKRRLLRAWVLAPILTAFVLLTFQPRLHADDEARYVAPVLLAAVLVVGARAMEILSDAGSINLKVQGVGAAAAAIGLVVHLHEARATTAQQFTDAINTLRRIWASPPTLGAQSDSYEKMQAHAAPGAAILSMTSHPYLLDFARNRIRLLDIPGLAGPAGGFPVDGTEADMVRYLRGEGIRYLAISSERLDPYDMRIWRSRSRNIPSRTDVEVFPQASWAPVIVSVVDMMDRLSKDYVAAYGDDVVKLVDLTKAVPASERQP